jgi:class I fructose-bisphosphate aldolase
MRETGARMSGRVREILSWYGSDNPGTLTNLARLLNAGALAGTGHAKVG